MSFYREKPANQGVGKVPGIIHHASKLFDPAFVRDQTARMLARHHAAGPFAFGGSLDPRDRASEMFVPDWVIDEVRAQARFEPMLTDVYNPERTPRAFKTLPRRANVALAYRDLCEDLDDRPKVIISATEKHMVAADMMIAEAVASVASTAGPDVQVICLIDGEKFHWDRRFYQRKYRALMLDITRFRREYQLEDWYLSLRHAALRAVRNPRRPGFWLRFLSSPVHGVQPADLRGGQGHTIRQRRAKRRSDRRCTDEYRKRLRPVRDHHWQARTRVGILARVRPLHGRAELRCAADVSRRS